MNVIEGVLYTKEHEWVKINGAEALFGITDHAQHALGDITYVGLPKTGSAVTQKNVFATVESVKAASDVYAPLSGTVTAVNAALEASPDIVNQSPYEKGWFVTVRVANEAEKNALMTAAQYRAYLEGLPA